MSKTVIVAPLNWGLGHATRCIPIIEHLIAMNCKVIMASDGESLMLLKKRFNQLIAIELPSYHIRYSDTQNMTWSIIRQLPKIYWAILREEKVFKELVRNYQPDLIISDNRYGARHKQVKSIFITHQLNLQMPEILKTWQSYVNSVQAYFINRFDECWVPDVEDENRKLSGSLSDEKYVKIPVSFIGVLSRLSKKDLSNQKKYDIVAILSGPEPQRTIFEGLLLKQLTQINLNSLMIRGKINDPVELEQRGNIAFRNFADENMMGSSLHAETFVIARSGYSTVMDLSQLGLRCLLIPTPGQTEQEYLASHLSKAKYILTQSQHDINIREAIQSQSTIAPLFLSEKNNLRAIIQKALESQ
jgi:uncharacterized protein (TIGR00661 family)